MKIEKLIHIKYCISTLFFASTLISVLAFAVPQKTTSKTHTEDRRAPASTASTSAAKNTPTVEELTQISITSYLTQFTKLFQNQACIETSPYLRCFQKAEQYCRKSFAKEIQSCAKQMEIFKVVKVDLVTWGRQLSENLGACATASFVKTHALEKRKTSECNARETWQ